MGCAPPHVALVSGLDGTGLGGKEITETLRAVAAAHGPASGRVLPKCKVMQNGCVLVGIECPGSLEIARALSAALPGADPYYANQRPDQQLMTLGRFAGTDAAGFAAWLSESLAGQRTLLPEIRCVSVQLSEEAHPFPNPQIALTGLVRGGSDGLGVGLGSGVGLGLNLGVGLGLGGGFGGFERASYAGDYGVGASTAAVMTGSYGAAAAAAPVETVAPMSAPPMPSTPPPQRAAVAATAAAATPPSYASAIGAVKVPAAAAPAPTVPPVVAMSPPKPPGGSFAQRTAAGASAAQPTPAGGMGSSAPGAPQVQTPEQLLGMFQQLTAGAEGSGVLCAGHTNGTYALRPQNTASWSQRLAPLVSVLQTTLANVGASRFLAMLDRVANPYGTSVAAELGARLSARGAGARLEIVQDPNLFADLENTPVVASNQGAHVRIVCTPVNQSVVGAMGHSNTASCVIVGTVKERGAPQAVDGSSAGASLTRLVPVALHLEPIANVPPSAGSSPYLMLTFAWIALVAPGSGSDSSALPAPQQSAAAPGVRRPGDWTCSRCSAHNFSSRSSCFKCKRGKESSANEGTGGVGSPGGSKASSEAGGGGAAASAGAFRAGDWLCGTCRAHNFSSRDQCFKCDSRKTGDETPPQQQQHHHTPDNFRSGDWICSGCGSHNFASRVSCFRCTRPAS